MEDKKQSYASLGYSGGILNTNSTEAWDSRPKTAGTNMLITSMPFSFF